MSKRLKRVFTKGDQVIHLWANQSQTDARSKNVFFEGLSVWSYGRHYELGRLHKVRGQTIALINSHRYSATTAKHQSWARQAVSHLLSLESSDVSSIETAVKETQSRLVSDLMGFFSRRKFWTGQSPTESSSHLVSSVNEFNKVCDAAKMKAFKLELNQDFIDLMSEHFTLTRQKQSVNEKIKEEKRLIKLEAMKVQAIEDLKSWRVGGQLTNALRSLEPQAIRVLTRISDGGQVVETTRGASVPFNEAVRLLTRIVKGEAKEGDKIGSFTFNGLEGSIVQIGCHKISIDEAKEVLKAA